MNYEIPFARAQNQLHAARISFGDETIGKKKSIFWPKQADLLLNTDISSRISERSFKQISFHAKFTFGYMFKAATTHLLDHGHRRKYLCNFNSAKEKTCKPSLLCVPWLSNDETTDYTGRPTISFIMSIILDHILRCPYAAVKKKLSK